MFLNEFNNPWRSLNVNDRLERAIEAIRKECTSFSHKKITCHFFRHTFTSRLRKAGVDVIVIQALLGHSKSLGKGTGVTVGYIHITFPMLVEGVARLEACNDVERKKVSAITVVGNQIPELVSDWCQLPNEATEKSPSSEV